MLRHFPGDQQGTIIIATGFTPRVVLVTGQAGAGFFAIAHSEPGSGIEQMGYAFDTSGHGGWATHSGVLADNFGARWIVTRMNETDVRITQPNGGAFQGWIAVIGEE